MYFSFCPLCGAKRLQPLSEPGQSTCMQCHHIFAIRDVLADAMVSAGLPRPLYVLPTDEECASGMLEANLEKECGHEKPHS